jgi:DNA ligase-1
MGSPVKRRKLNDSSKSSPVASRSLDFFFGKQKQNVPSSPANGKPITENSVKSSELTDEELARKLQAEWDQEPDPATGASAAVKGSRDQSAEIEIDKQEINKDTSASGGRCDDLGRASSAVQTEPRPAQTKEKSTLSLQSTGSEEDIITSNIPFDESPLTFEPSKYVSELQSHWAAEGGNASYALLTRCFVLVNGTQSRIKIVDTLVNLLRVIIEGDPSSLLPTVRTKYYCFNPIARSAILSLCVQYVYFYHIHSVPT